MDEARFDVPQAIRVRRPPWVNARTVLGLLLFSVAFLGAQRLLAGADSGVLVWVAARDLGRGHRLSPEDLELAKVRLPADQLARYASSARPVERSLLTRPVLRGELIPTAWLTAQGAHAAAAEVAIPVTPDRAVGGYLGVGDRVNVYARPPGAGNELVVAGAEVVRLATSGGIVGEDALFAVIVNVTVREAAQLVEAIHGGELTLVKVLGAPSSGVLE